MKIVINKCYGGFSLSMAATKRLAELRGRKCFFFKNGLSSEYEQIFETKDGERESLFWSAFDIPNPNAIFSKKKFSEQSEKMRERESELYDKHYITNRPEDRTDKLLIQVVEEMGERASGGCAKLGIVEIPDGTDWEIDEYDGIESVHEKHRSWG